MPGVILAVLESPDIASRVLAGARRLAELTDATRINVVAIRMPPIATIIPSEEILTRQQENRIRAEERHRADTLKAVFNAWAGTVQERDLAEWFDIEDLADKVCRGTGTTRGLRRAEAALASRPRAGAAGDPRGALRG